ncbi:hypothetical protein C4D60_Mb04t12850 [Musa balbisiana]|uniref:Uncharacterized protein n=1 Tax=Musa balbisiana TaxID=52838 RepID=A0A4V6T4R6_MUSBA|nr:hypothetical protein C4D60_Mb04t12850 [Musa balbisiana]
MRIHTTTKPIIYHKFISSICMVKLGRPYLLEIAGKAERYYQINSILFVKGGVQLATVHIELNKYFFYPMKWFAPSQRSSKYFALCAINPKHGKTEQRNPGFSPRDPSRGREGKRDGNGEAELHAAAAFCLRRLHPSAAKTSFCYQRGILLDLASSKTESF